MTDRSVPCISITTPECDASMDQNEKESFQKRTGRQVLVHLPVYYLPSCQPSAISALSPKRVSMLPRKCASGVAHGRPYATCPAGFVDQVKFPEDDFIHLSGENGDKDDHSETSSDDSSEDLMLHGHAYSVGEDKGHQRTSCSETEEDSSAYETAIVAAKGSDVVFPMLREPRSIESSYGLRSRNIAGKSCTQRENWSHADTVYENTQRKRQLEGTSMAEESPRDSRTTTLGRNSKKANARAVRFSGSPLASPQRPASTLDVPLVKNPTPWKAGADVSLLVPGLPAPSPHVSPSPSLLPSPVRAVQDMVGGDLIYVNMIDSITQAMERVETSKLRQVPYTPRDYTNTIQWYRDHQRARMTYHRASVLAGESLLRGEVEGDAEDWLNHLVQLAADREQWRHRRHCNAALQSRDTHPGQGGLPWLRSWARSLVLRCGHAFKMVLYPPPCCNHPVTLASVSRKSP